MLATRTSNINLKPKPSIDAVWFGNIHPPQLAKARATTINSANSQDRLKCSKTTVSIYTYLLQAHVCLFHITHTTVLIEILAEQLGIC